MSSQQDSGSDSDDSLCTRCVSCEARFYFPVNYSRHRWRHKTFEEQRKLLLKDAVVFWQQLDKEKAHDIISTDSLILEFEKLDVNGLLECVSRKFSFLAADSPYLRQALSLYKAVHGEKHLGVEEMLTALNLLTENNFLCYSLDPGTLEIIFSHANESDESKGRNAFALFAYLVEHRLAKACSDFVEKRARLVSAMMDEAEIEAQQQMVERPMEKTKNAGRQNYSAINKDTKPSNLAADFSAAVGHGATSQQLASGRSTSEEATSGVNTAEKENALNGDSLQVQDRLIRLFWILDCINCFGFSHK